MVDDIMSLSESVKPEVTEGKGKEAMFGSYRHRDLELVHSVRESRIFARKERWVGDNTPDVESVIWYYCIQRVTTLLYKRQRESYTYLTSPFTCMGHALIL